VRGVSENRGTPDTQRAPTVIERSSPPTRVNRTPTCAGPRERTAYRQPAFGKAVTKPTDGPLHSATRCPALPLQDRRCGTGGGGEEDDGAEDSDDPVDALLEGVAVREGWGET
jgi:hypothetical protein